MPPVNLRHDAVVRFVAGTLVNDAERAELADSVLRALVSGPYASGTDRSALDELFSQANPGMLARLLEARRDQPEHGHLAAFVSHVLRVSSALLRIADDQATVALVLHDLPVPAQDTASAAAQLIALATDMQTSALGGDIEKSYAYASIGARIVRVCSSSLPGTLGAMRELVIDETTESDLEAARREYCALASRLLAPDASVPA